MKPPLTMPVLPPHESVTEVEKERRRRLLAALAAETRALIKAFQSTN
jgi:hypothetical protein